MVFCPLSQNFMKKRFVFYFFSLKSPFFPVFWLNDTFSCNFLWCKKGYGPLLWPMIMYSFVMRSSFFLFTVKVPDIIFIQHIYLFSLRRLGQMLSAFTKNFFCVHQKKEKIELRFFMKTKQMNQSRSKYYHFFFENVSWGSHLHQATFIFFLGLLVSEKYHVRWKKFAST